MNITRKRSFLLLTSALGLSMALSANAANTAANPTARTTDNAAATAPAPAEHAGKTSRMETHGSTTGHAAATSPTEVPASRLIGERVVNGQGERLGKVKDLVIDTTTGKVQYAVMSFGGFLGVGNKLFAYPMRSFQPGRDGDQLVLNVDKDKLKNAPGFDDKNWPDFNKGNYRAEVDRYHGAKGDNDAQSGTPVKFARASKMLKADVKDTANNKDIGDVNDLVVDLKDGRVHFVVVKFDRALHPADRLVALPMRAFKAEGRNDKDLVFAANRDEAQNATPFDKSRWPDANRDNRARANADRTDQSAANQADTAARSTHR